MSALLRIFQTTAAREAYRFDSNHVGRIVNDLEDGIRYLVYAEGLGADVLFPLDPDALGGGDVGIWTPAAPPTSPHAKDDEFTVASGLWTEGDAGAYATFTLDSDRKMLKTSGTGGGGRQLAYYAQAVTASSEFAIYTRVGLQPYAGASGVSAGLFVGQNVISDPTNSDVRVLTAYSASGIAGIASATFTAYNAAPTATQTRDPMMAPWLRIRQNGTAFEADFSVDGNDWRRISTQSLGFTPSHFGLVFESIDAQPGVAYFDFFRVFEGVGASGADGTKIGRYL